MHGERVERPVAVSEIRGRGGPEPRVAAKSATEAYRSGNWVRDSRTAVPRIEARCTWWTSRIAGATRMIAAATARHVVSQFVPRSAGGIKAAETRKSMRTARIARFRTTMKMVIGISAGCRRGSFLAM